MKESIGTIIRTLLKVGGGWFIAKGFADEAQVEAITGAIVTIVGVVWGIVAAKKAAQDRQVLHPNEKSSIAGPLVLLLCAGLAFSPAMLTGCGTTKPTPQAVLYMTLADTKAIVDNAEKVYGNQVVLGKVSAADQRKIDAKIVDFHAAYLLAVKAARLNYSLKTPADVQALADQLIAMINRVARK